MFSLIFIIREKAVAEANFWFPHFLYKLFYFMLWYKRYKDLRKNKNVLMIFPFLWDASNGGGDPYGGILIGLLTGLSVVLIYYSIPPIYAGCKLLLDSINFYKVKDLFYSLYFNILEAKKIKLSQIAEKSEYARKVLKENAIIFLNEKYDMKVTNINNINYESTEWLNSLKENAMLTEKQKFACENVKVYLDEVLEKIKNDEEVLMQEIDKHFSTILEDLFEFLTKITIEYGVDVLGVIKRQGIVEWKDWIDMHKEILDKYQYIPVDGLFASRTTIIKSLYDYVFIVYNKEAIWSKNLWNVYNIKSKTYEIDWEQTSTFIEKAWELKNIDMVAEYSYYKYIFVVEGYWIQFADFIFSLYFFDSFFIFVNLFFFFIFPSLVLFSFFEKINNFFTRLYIWLSLLLKKKFKN